MDLRIPRRRVVWKPCWRIVPSRFPPIQVFERVVDPADLEAVIAIESLTNDRLRDEVGDLSLVPPDERITGPGSSIIMAAFTHPNPDGSRFGDGLFGVFYAAADLETAISETRYHRERFLKATREPPMELDMRVYLADLDAALHDIRGRRDSLPEVYSATDYNVSQRFAIRLRAAGSHGIVYDSVRRMPGSCCAVFRPRCLGNARQERHLCYAWDGGTISHIYEKRIVTQAGAH
jgi:RES domain